METSLDILNEIIQRMKEFTKVNKREPVDLEEFILWLNSFFYSDNQLETHGTGESQLEMEMTFLMVMLNRYYKAYAKKVYLGKEVSSADAYSFIFHLNLVDSYRKMELIRLHKLEPPSGIEVIKRLLKKEFIEEYDDPDDGRARRVKITHRGKAQIELLEPGMQQVFQQMTGGMNLNEKLHVLSFLRKMNAYHEQAES